MDPIQSLLVALEAQGGLVGAVSRSDLLSPSKCPGWTCLEVLNHSIAVTLRFASFASGETERPLLPRGDLVGSNPGGSLGAAVERARQAWATTDRTRVCYLSFGEFDAETAAGVNLVDVLSHGWDIGPLQGRRFACGDEVWVTGLVASQALIGPHRDLRHYGPELVAGPDASCEEQFLAYLGRSSD